MTTPTIPTMTPDARRDMHLWGITLERLLDEADPDGQLAALRCFAKLPDVELPIRSIADVVLTTTSDEDGTLYWQDTDPIWKAGMDALRRAATPVSLDLEMIVNSLTLAFECDTSTDQMLEFIGTFAGKIELRPFVDLLTNEEASHRRAGVEALYKLGAVVPLLPMLDDPDPATRAVAIENVWLLEGMPLDQLHIFADDPAQPKEVHEMATYYYAKAMQQSPVA